MPLQNRAASASGPRAQSAVFFRVKGSALFSSCRRYRYLLTRRWAPGPTALWIMLNPSTADAQRDDPTIRRCIGFSRRWGFGSMHAVNLFALRSTDPGALLEVRDPVGPDTDRHICAQARSADRVIAAWGAFPLGQARGAELLDRLPVPIHSLGRTASGAPRHPLYLRATARPRPFTRQPAPVSCAIPATARRCAW
jgi:hypothetical protein